MYPAKPSTNTIYLLGRHLVTELINQKLLAENYTEKELERWVLLAFQIAHKFSQSPFTPQKEILNDLKLEPTQLKKLNTVLRLSSVIQSFICDFGAAWKYWHNTIIPTVSSDGFSAVINRRLNAHSVLVCSPVFPACFNALFADVTMMQGTTAKRDFQEMTFFAR